MIYSRLLVLLFVLFTLPLCSQHNSQFSKDDTLRGSITEERAWWDLKYYQLSVEVFPEEKSIKGDNIIRYKVLEPNQKIQIDLQPPLTITYASQDGNKLNYEKIGTNSYHIFLQKTQITGSTEEIKIEYSGKPKPALRAPWDGGFSWKKDKDDNHYIATSCQGLGASVWWPCKDHMYDEPDGMLISVTVPDNLMDVSNGKLINSTENSNNTKTFHWKVSNPINNYGVNLNIGNYTHFSEIINGEKGKLEVDYYVLPYNLNKAKEQFKQVPLIIKAFEHWFGPYPFYEDGFKIVEVPYLGMEHQSSVTYGNGYNNGYLGTDLSGTGWGMKWDYILIHESGHEWFANNITYKDMADMWIHESFTTYSESLYTEYHFGKQAGAEYVKGLRKKVYNKTPIISQYNVNSSSHDTDKYYKGANMLHTIRQIVADDEKWRSILRGLNKEFYHKTVDTKQIEDYMILKSGKKLQKVFEQYLRNASLPKFEYKLIGDNFKYRWTDCIEGFDMPMKIFVNKKSCELLNPTTEWKSMKMKPNSTIELDDNFFVN